ncbi:MAG: cupin domain-containing protein [Chloroflexota bacterium]|nr:cupin domain-containing protein [Chloroflexota bacterium]
MKIQNYRDVRPDSEIPGVALHTVISAEDGAPRFSMRVFEVQPGASTPFHSHWWEHEVFILSGQGKVRGTEGERELKPNDAVYVPGDEQHCFVNSGSEALRFICCIPHNQNPSSAAEAPRCDQ